MNVNFNPVSKKYKRAFNEASKKIVIVVPFISTYAKHILAEIPKIKDLRLITRYDSSELISFDLDTLKWLLEKGFKIIYLNNLHSKLYITDKILFVTSGNLTNGGLNDNHETTIEITTDNDIYSKVEVEIENMWMTNQKNEITLKNIEDDYPKYLMLKSKNKIVQKKYSPFETNPIINVNLTNKEIEKIKNQIFFKESSVYNTYKDLIFKAHEKRKEKVMLLFKNPRNINIFYAKTGSPNRNNCIFYDFVYGYESELAGTGLREHQIEKIFTNPNFIRVIEYIYPMIFSGHSYNFKDEVEKEQFIKTVFDLRTIYNLSEFSEVMPIRLMSYFYPEHFLHIFKIEHLESICNILGYSALTEKSKAERYSRVSIFIDRLMNGVNEDSYIKSMMLYALYYTFMVLIERKNGKDFEKIEKEYGNKKVWKLKFIEEAKRRLLQLDLIE